MSQHRTIVADPPWPYSGSIAGASPEHRPNSYSTATNRASSKIRYGAMSLEELFAIRPEAGGKAHLYVWTTNSFIESAHELARAWGFKPKTVLTWGKVKPDGTPSMKMGTWFRGATEHIVFAVRGSLKLQCDEALPTFYLWPRLPHSVKPDAFYDLVEKASPGPYLELFARRARFGWDYWGDESLNTASLNTEAS